MWSNNSRRFRSLKSRLALWVLLPTILLMVVELLATYYKSEQIATLVQQRLLNGAAEIIADQVAMIDESYEVSVSPAVFELLASKKKDRIYYSVHTKEGKLIAGGDELDPYPAPLKIEDGQYYETNLHGEPVRVIALADSVSNSYAGDYVITQVAQTLRDHDDLRDSLVRDWIHGHLLLLSITIIALIIALRWTLSPLIEFGRVLLQREPGSLEEVKISSAPTELKPVIRAMNEYVDRLRATLSSYEKFVSDTAHHLRTPFAIITSQVDIGRKNECENRVHRVVMDTIQKATKRGARITNQLLMLASVEQIRKDSCFAEDVQLSELIITAIETLAPLARKNEIELGVGDFDESIHIAASTELLHEVISNLVDNSIQHMGKPGAVIVSLYRKEEFAVVRITDNGVGIPEDMHQKIFERFFKINKSCANSSGLGLAIVKEICALMNAKITLGTPSCGAGLEVTIEFPIMQ